MSDDLVERLRQPWDTDRSIMSQTGRWMTEREDAADRIEELQARAEAAEAKLAELVEVSKRAVRLSRDHPDFKLYAMEPMERAIANAELKGQTDEWRP